MLRFYVVPESQDSCLSSYFQPWQNRSNCNPWVTNVMEKVSRPHRFHFCASFDDFISFIHLFLPFFHELVCCFERAIPWVIQSRNSFHLFDILFSLRNGPYKICISFPWVRWYIWYWFAKYQMLLYQVEWRPLKDKEGINYEQCCLSDPVVTGNALFFIPGNCPCYSYNRS